MPAASEASSRRFFSVGFRLTATVVAVLTLVTLLVSYELTTRERETILASKSQAAAMVGDLLAAGLVAPLDFADAESIDAELKNLQHNREVSFAAVWAPGANKPTAHLYGVERGLTALVPPEAPGIRVLADRVEVVRVVTRADGKRLGVVMVVFSLAKENEAFASTKRNILGLSLVVGAITAALLLAIARRQIVKPLERMMQGALRIERGERDVRVDVTSRDEIGTLGEVFNQMSAAIVEREKSLAEATRSLRELFDHMRQAIVVFRADGGVEAIASAQAKAIFGDVEGTSIRELLYPNEPADSVLARAFDEWRAVAFDLPADAWGDVATLAPREATVGERFLALEFRPVVQEGRVARVMMLATDETERHRLAEEVRTKEEEHGRQMRAMRRLVAGGGQVFVAFLAGSAQRLARCEEILREAGSTLPEAEIDEVFAHIHTIQGEANAFDLARVVVEVRAIEAELSLLKDRARSSKSVAIEAERALWLERLDRAKRSLDEAREQFVAASPIGAAILDQVTVRRSDVDRLVEVVADRGGELGDVASRLAARPFGEAVATLAEKVPSWAASLGKRGRLVVEGREQLVSPRLARVLPGVLAHLVRNAVAHGIEPISSRDRTDKPSTGTIRVGCDVHDGQVSVVVEDDGGGIDVDALGGLDAAFEPGVTSKRDGGDMAGRGMGLAAVRSELASIGYRVKLESRPGHGARFTLTPED